MTARRRSADGWRARVARRMRYELREQLSFWVLIGALTAVGVLGMIFRAAHPEGNHQEGNGGAAAIRPLTSLAGEPIHATDPGPATTAGEPPRAPDSTPPTVTAAGGSFTEAADAGRLAALPDPPRPADADPRGVGDGSRHAAPDGGAPHGGLARALPRLGPEPVAAPVPPAAQPAAHSTDDPLIPGSYAPTTDSTGRLELRIVATYRGPADWRPPAGALATPPDREHAAFWPTQDAVSPDGRTLRYAARIGWSWPPDATTGPRLLVACSVSPPRRPTGTLMAVAWEPLAWPRNPPRPGTAATWTVAIPEGLEPPCVATLHVRTGPYERRVGGVAWRWQGGVTWEVVR